MCGIVGYVGEKDATPVLINALKKLEYRGYDSTGIAVLNGNFGNQSLVVRKSKGALSFLEKKIATEIISGSVGIGHTRWATHGEPSDENSHPHTDISNSIAVVHNGIIENYQDLKTFLKKNGIIFKSQTDTEVIAHLIHFFYKGDLLEAVKQTTQKLVGSYAIAVLCKDQENTIVAARKDSPLVIGQGKNEFILASDIPPILDHSRNVYYMEDNEFVLLKKNEIAFFDNELNPVEKNTVFVDWDVSSAEKDGYEHFMLKEIHQQPKAILDTLKPRLISYENSISINLSEIPNVRDWVNCKRIVIVACGTSFHAGIVGKYVLENLARLPVEVDIASEYRYRNPIMSRDDIFIVISQSGETADTLAAMRMAKKAGAKTIAITNVVGSTLAREADYIMYTWAGTEIAVASTKAFSTQLMSLYIIALKLAQFKKALSQNEIDSFLQELIGISDKVQEILDSKETIQKTASKTFNKSKVFFMGRLADYGISLESALKLKEISYTHSEAFSAGELKHGPIALVDTNTLVVAFCTQEKLYDKMESNIKEVKARGATVMCITKQGESRFNQVADSIIFIPVAKDIFTPLLSIVPSQLYAYYCAVHRGNNPDKPRNLAKSVTVE